MEFSFYHFIYYKSFGNVKYKYRGKIIYDAKFKTRNDPKLLPINRGTNLFKSILESTDFDKWFTSQTVNLHFNNYQNN